MLELGYSFCPNDTFIFYALTHGRISTTEPVQEVLEDVETLNQWALGRKLQITKISYRAYAEVRDQYVALRSGGALGRGVGPLIVTKGSLSNLNGKTIASPGALTTAESLLKLYAPEANVVRKRYDQIMPAVQSGEVDAGLIIHESRFTYPDHGLQKHLDLGAWWEENTGLPLPLGAILVRRDLPTEVQRELNQAVRSSLEYAYAHPEEPRSYIRQHALEMSDPVMQAHIDLYVNEFSLDVGDEGEKAVRELFSRLEKAGVIRGSGLPLFVG
ncbi:1,4-dihydroxy-6-naphthoate synthase [Deinococcus cellulosilyticus]|uniref:1,4-dihydroxy-6-naphtoate synthase n=1 Tax=Deinococcus cellulosilyticus (strain DSM 18568 / NBRC 106333 / KACC 11606 / 5516J-15) TaxID=1223518 RepID=A0A511N3M5_DEIC1|nr:1,4-dihydroxy-6-naphthoate synthase [Deinococcus cellulosilyticus]GEM47469.1 1,4-dihydroxy-6-naphtoate synthase [Deinococcus cellulosilyticus NBRC 106333 = KACC 11606]